MVVLRPSMPRRRGRTSNMADLLEHFGNPVRVAGERVKSGHEPVHSSRSGTCLDRLAGHRALVVQLVWARRRRRHARHAGSGHPLPGRRRVADRTVRRAGRPALRRIRSRRQKRWRVQRCRSHRHARGGPACLRAPDLSLTFGAFEHKRGHLTGLVRVHLADALLYADTRPS